MKVICSQSCPYLYQSVLYFITKSSSTCFNVFLFVLPSNLTLFGLPALFSTPNRFGVEYHWETLAILHRSQTSAICSLPPLSCQGMPSPLVPTVPPFWWIIVLDRHQSEPHSLSHQHFLGAVDSWNLWHRLASLPHILWHLQYTQLTTLPFCPTTDHHIHSQPHWFLIQLYTHQFHLKYLSVVHPTQGTMLHGWHPGQDCTWQHCQPCSTCHTSSGSPLHCLSLRCSLADCIPMIHLMHLWGLALPPPSPWHNPVSSPSPLSTPLTQPYRSHSDVWTTMDLHNQHITVFWLPHTKCSKDGEDVYCVAQPGVIDPSLSWKTTLPSMTHWPMHTSLHTSTQAVFAL